jgi:hypothetical protein
MTKCREGMLGGRFSNVPEPTGEVNATGPEQ